MGMVFEMTVGMVQMMGVFTIRDRNAIYKLERSARFVESNGSESRNDSVNVMAGIKGVKQGKQIGCSMHLYAVVVDFLEMIGTKDEAGRVLKEWEHFITKSNVRGSSLTKLSMSNVRIDNVLL